MVSPLHSRRRYAAFQDRFTAGSSVIRHVRDSTSGIIRNSKGNSTIKFRGIDVVDDQDFNASAAPPATKKEVTEIVAAQAGFMKC